MRKYMTLEAQFWPNHLVLQVGKPRPREGNILVLEKYNMSLHSTSEKMGLSNSQNNVGREGVSQKGGNRDTRTPPASAARTHSRPAPEADITPHTLGAT
jgi:hypothetical protein